MTTALDATPLTVPTGGVARYTLALARALAQEFPVDQHWLISDQPFPHVDGQPNLHCAGSPTTFAERKWWLIGANREMARRKVDVFHGTDFSVPYIQQRPSVMTLHDLSPWLNPVWQPDSARVRRRTPRLLRWGLATMVVTPTEAIRRAAIERFQLDPNRVAVTHLAADPQFHPVAASPATPPYFLFVGTLEPRKNATALIEAWREVRKSHAVDLVLVGRVRGDFTKPAAEVGLRLLGAVPDKDLPGLYSGALATVYPSLYEGFGLPVLEAMQCGSLVITSRDPSIMEVSGGTALHIDATSQSGLVDAMTAVALRPEGFRHLSERAIMHARTFTWRRTARQTREVYDEAVRVFRT